MHIRLDIGSHFPQISGPMSDQFADELVKIEGSSYDEVTLDFKGTETISSMAMGTLFATHRKMKEQNRKLMIINASPHVKKVLTMLKMNDMFVPDDDEKK